MYVCCCHCMIFLILFTITVFIIVVNIDALYDILTKFYSQANPKLYSIKPKIPRYLIRVNAYQLYH